MTYRIENATQGNVYLMKGAIDLSADETMILPDYARNHPDVVKGEEDDLINVTPIEEGDYDESEEKVVDLSDDTGDEKNDTESSESSSKETAEKASTEEEEEEVGEEKETDEEVELEEGSGGLIPVKEFERLNKEPMQEKLVELGLDSDIDLSATKPELVEHYEKCYEELTS